MDESATIHNNLTQQYFKEVVAHLLPNALEGGSTMWSTGDNNHENWEIDYVEFSPYMANGSLCGSKYEYNKSELKFIHYTDTNAVKSIIESAKMRMYSLASMKDDKELSFALENIVPNKSDFYIQGYKDEVFSLSMNEFQDEEELKQTWIDYGKEGKGIALVISFPKETQKLWHQQYLSKIHYQKEKLDALKQFHEAHLDFKSRNNWNSVRGSIKNFVLPLAAFHKTNGFEKENETRFILVNKDAYTDKEMNTIIFDNEKSYINLELNKLRQREVADRVFENQFGFADKAMKEHTVPKIEKIIIGSKVSSFETISEELKLLSIQNLDYEINIERSKISFKPDKLVVPNSILTALIK